MACALLATASFVARFAFAADTPAWLAERTLAAQKAADEQKLLLVIDLGGDFLADVAASPQAKLYRSLALSDPRVAKLLESRFIVTFRNVGPSAAVQRVNELKKGERQMPSSDGAIAFICLPNLRVLHFVCGLAPAETLLAELTWADACNRERLRSSPDEQQWLMHQRHIAAVPEADRAVFLDDSRAKVPEAPVAGRSQQNLVAAIRRAKSVRNQTLTERLKANWPDGAAQHALLTSLAMHGDLAPILAHLTLARYPLPKLAEIERPLYEIAFEQRFWELPHSGKTLVDWCTEARRTGAPLLLIVRDDPFYAGELGEGEALFWPPLPGYRMSPHLRLMQSKVVTLDELAALASGAGLEPIRFAAGQSPPRYLIHSAAGFRLAQLSAREGTTQRLSQTLQRILHPGGLAAATGSEGEPTDEEK
jgi:hypothetical protein